MDYRMGLIPGVIGTTAMTAYSYGASMVAGENFVEPKLLNLLLERRGAKVKPITGWLIHYLLGSIWARALIQLRNRKPALMTTGLLAIGSGLCGVLCWRYMFKWHRRPPTLSYNRFYRQLFTAHVLFLLTAVKTDAVLDANSARGVINAKSLPAS